MNIVTSVGYGDMFGTTNTERVTTMFIILTGDALFAVAFGMMASITETEDSESKKYHDEVNEIRDLFTSSNVPKTLLNRMERYYAYRSAMN
jgi:hypothetical protein